MFYKSGKGWYNKKQIGRRIKEMKLKVFISQPFGDKSKKEIKKERRGIKKELERQGYEVLDTIIGIEEDGSPIKYLAKEIEIMDRADIVMFMEGWERARGCIIEHEVALRYGKFVIELGGIYR